MVINLLNLFKNVENPVTFSAGETIFTEGTPGEEMYVVLAGSVNILVGGKEMEVAEPGAIIGEMALIDSSARSATTTAKTDCRLAPVDEKKFMFMVEQTPFFALHVMKVMANRLRHMDAQG